MQALMLVFPGADQPDALLAALQRDAIEVDLAEPRLALFERAPPDGVVVAYLALNAPDALLSQLAAWRDRGAGATRLIGCSPTGNGADSERALAAGFDDFMAGRSSTRELSARLRALGRGLRKDARPRPAERLRFGRLVVDRSRHEVTVGEHRAAVTSLELRTLTALIEAGGGAVSRAELLDRVWGEDDLDVGLRAVDNLVCRLRRKLSDPRLLVTVRGVGFRLAR